MDINAIRAALHRRPFQPFTMRLVDGRELPIPHPDFVATSPRQVIVIHPDESHTILEPILIISLEVPKNGQPAGSQQGRAVTVDENRSDLRESMPDDLTFLMGKFPAELPGQLRYAPRNHMWCLPGDRYCRFGFTAYAVRLMQDVYFLDWTVSPGQPLHFLQQIGHIETSKAESDLFAPIEGTITAFNADLLKDPSAINVDKYGAGWLFDMEGDISTTLDVAQYHQHLAANWEHTQRLIKGKINTED